MNDQPPGVLKALNRLKFELLRRQKSGDDVVVVECSKNRKEEK